MDKKDLSGKDLLLAILYCPGVNGKKNEPIIGRTKLTKMMFLFEKEIYKKFFKEIEIINLPNFEPYHFGPFSKDVFDDLKFFISIGLINTSETDIPIASADKFECEAIIDEEAMGEWVNATFDCSEEVELQYFLSKKGEQYVEEKLWNRFSEQQQKNLQLFKSKINTITLDALLRYVYNKYPEYTTKSIIADKYVNKENEE